MLMVILTVQAAQLALEQALDKRLSQFSPSQIS
jgi:hypothetical protein